MTFICSRTPFSDELGKIFQGFYDSNPHLPAKDGWNSFHHKDYVVYQFLVPGVLPDDVSVEHNEGMINIRAKRNSSVFEGAKLHDCSFGRCNFVWNVPLLNDAQGELAKADLENGILTVTIPRKNERKRIDVKYKGG